MVRLLLAHVEVTKANIAHVRQLIASDQAREVRSGSTVSVYTHDYATNNGMSTGTITVYHNANRAAVDYGGPSVWGDYDDVHGTVVLDDSGELIELSR